MHLRRSNTKIIRSVLYLIEGNPDDGVWSANAIEGLSHDAMQYARRTASINRIDFLLTFFVAVFWISSPWG